MNDVAPKTWAEECFTRSDYRVLSSDDGIDAVVWESVPWKGHGTDVHAYLGVPADADGPVPGMVLVHGGGGTAFREWVEMWVARGYAAVAMDLTGRDLDGNRHDRSGPPQDHAVIFDPALPWPDTWTYHAIAAAVRGHSILRALPGVDASRIGVTGISWGGYLTCIVSGVDDRFGCAVPVYGCGFLRDNSADDWMTEFAAMSEPELQQWHEWCDPSSYLPQARMPMLFVNGTNDFAYPPDSHTKSARLPKGRVTMCVRHEMPHGHPDGWAPPEIQAFADAIFRGGNSYPAMSDMTSSGGWWSATLTGGVAPYSGHLLYTCDVGKWQERKWHDVPAGVDEGVVSADVPEDATVWYLAAEDARGMYVSTFQRESERSGA